MERRDTRTASGPTYTAIGMVATAGGGYGSWAVARDAGQYAGLLGNRGTFQVSGCTVAKDGKTTDVTCRGTIQVGSNTWPAAIDEMPRSYPPHQTMAAYCLGSDCRRPDTASAAGCLMGLCFTLVVLGAGLLALLKAVRCRLGPDFARITQPRLAAWVSKGFLALWLGVLLLFFGSAIVLFATFD